MAHTYTTDPTPEQRATLALWALTGVGGTWMETQRQSLGSGLADLLDLPLETWRHRLEGKDEALKELKPFARLEDFAQAVEAMLVRTQTRVAFPGEVDFPRLLVGIPGQPPVLFVKGATVREGRQLAMVGSREPDARGLEGAQRFAAQVARRGVCVVSGAAVGIDHASHTGALKAGGLTWAFLGSSLDQIDPAQVEITRAILAGGGTLFSELPPGVRASKQTFPRRNRLISGASHAVLVVRAGKQSGALHTVDAAKEQGRPVLAVPGELYNPSAYGCNELIHDGRARLCLTVKQAIEAAGGEVGTGGEEAEAPPPVSLSELSPAAQRAYAALQRVPLPFEDVLVATGEDAGRLAIALTELELSGLAIQRPGKRYERI